MANSLTADEIEKRVSELGPWFHNLHLSGVQTAPDHFLGDYPSFKWKHFQHSIPGDLTGLTVLDVGCNAGFYSIQMKQRGAKRVLGIDHDEAYLAQARFAAEVSNLDISFEQLSVYEVGSLKEKFDLVIFMGVFYHLRHPLLALGFTSPACYERLVRLSIDAARQPDDPKDQRRVSVFRVCGV